MKANFMKTNKEVPLPEDLEQNQEARNTEQEKEQRYSLCEKCEFFHAATKRCQKCGCYLKWKTDWLSQKCPIGKW
jgi:hypothetical protein